MIKEKLIEWWSHICVAIFMWAGNRIFAFMVLWPKKSENDGLPKVVHFANSDAELNSAMRDYVDELDEQYKEKQNGTNKTS